MQADYAEWLAALPDNLKDSATADALEAIIDLDLTSLPKLSRHAATGTTEHQIDRTGKEKKRLDPNNPNQRGLSGFDALIGREVDSYRPGGAVACDVVFALTEQALEPPRWLHGGGVSGCQSRK